MFTDRKDEVNSSDLKSCVKFVGHCQKLLEIGQFDMEGNDIAGKFRMLRAGAPKKAVEVRKVIFEYFIDIRSTLKAGYQKYCSLLKESRCMKNTVSSNENGIEPEKLTFSNQQLKDWCREHQISVKKPNKRFSIKAENEKSIWTARYTFMKIYEADVEIVMADQMPLHRNESSQENTLNFKGAVQTTYVKKNQSLFQERVTLMTSVLFRV